MAQKEVYEYFVCYFPQFAEYVEDWFPNGKNSIRVRQTNGQDFIFTYNGTNNWGFETVNHFCDRDGLSRTRRDEKNV